jgi:hypothetical protein
MRNDSFAPMKNRRLKRQPPTTREGAKITESIDALQGSQGKAMETDSI